jgi:carbon-monoxide dehydrogenase medium subunit
VSAFAFASPHSLDQLLALLAERGPAARLLAGGTDLIVQLRSGRAAPDLVIDIKRVHGLSAAIEDIRAGAADAGAAPVLRVGARVTMARIARDARMRRHFPALVDAALVVGSVQIRNRATLAGNICNASPAADTAPALLVYGASVNIVGPAGARRLPLERFFAGPGRTALQSAELVSSIDLPLPDVATGAAFGRVTRRRGVDLATINLCALVNGRGDGRFAFGAVGPTPVLASDRGEIAAAASAGPEAFSDAMRLLLAKTSPISDVRGSREYRLAMLEVMTRRAVTAALERLRSEQRRGDSSR